MSSSAHLIMYTEISLSSGPEFMISQISFRSCFLNLLSKGTTRDTGNTQSLCSQDLLFESVLSGKDISGKDVSGPQNYPEV